MDLRLSVRRTGWNPSLQHGPTVASRVGICAFADALQVMSFVGAAAFAPPTGVGGYTLPAPCCVPCGAAIPGFSNANDRAGKNTFAIRSQVARPIPWPGSGVFRQSSETR